VLFISAFDTILALTVAIGENLGHNADTTRHILTDCWLEDYSVPDLVLRRIRETFLPLL
jgi:hypothetical protein